MANAVGHSRVTRRMDSMLALRDMTASLAAATDAEFLLATVMEQATALLDADRSTLFLIDQQRQELWSKIAQKLETHEIRTPITQGIAGTVATTGATANIPDAYADPRFNAEVDQQTGYQTRSILCMAVPNHQGTIVGVIEVLNRRTGVFTAEDERQLARFCAQAGVLISAMALSNRSS